MDLLLFRHAPAVDADPAEIERLGELTADARRSLSAEGRERFASMVEALEERGVRVDRILHSPWRRAVETAELLRPLLRGGTEVCAELAGAPTPALLTRLQAGRMALVGHQPWLGELVALLTGAPSGLIEWKKGGLVWLVGDPAPGAMTIRAVASRRLLVD